MIQFSADRIIEASVDEHAGRFEKVFGGHAILISGPLYRGVDDIVRSVVEGRTRGKRTRNKLAVVINTLGGTMEPVRRIVDVFRKHYSSVEFFIPNHAFSAGTILVMSGDAIHMDYYSRLGPIDPQEDAGSGKLVPVTGYLVKWKELLKKSESGQLTSAEMAVMLKGFNQAQLYDYEESLKESVEALVDWLSKWKFRSWKKTGSGRTVTPQLRRDRAREIANHLNDHTRWHSHGHGISRAVLVNRLKLVIDDLDSPNNKELKTALNEYFELAQDYMLKLRYRGRVHTVGRSEFYLGGN